ncbi:RNA polymerase sigma factor [Streptosporangium amethystogenes]|uniref:RNA polymerase sigma factor n=1 Tax=Streptosporangium amethystogenes TaxID=2002 RepID=UPI0014705B07|nr:sigma-70 family RNA polymerase sigma factor [Streptosporangium amethystogenes]
MTDGVLVEALRAREPAALSRLYDSYAESVYRYCHSMLGVSAGAELACLDTFIAAEAHIHTLADARRLEAWLYALARGECVRRDLAGEPDPRVPVPAGAGEADLRMMAWNATRSLSPEDREVLDLGCRHGFGPVDLAAVLGVTARVAAARYESARERLRDAVTAEVLVRKGPHDCASRARMLTGFTGELTARTRERVIRHVNRCDTCAPHRVRQVSAAKVFDLLPAVAPPPTLRARVMDCFTDPARIPYRHDVAHRVGPLDGAGFPAGTARGGRRRSYVMAGTAAAVAASAALALLLTQTTLRSEDTGPGAASGVFPASAEPPAVRRPDGHQRTGEYHGSEGSGRSGGRRRVDASPMPEPVRAETAVGRTGSLGVTEPVGVTGPGSKIDRPVPAPTRRPAETPPPPPGDRPSADGSSAGGPSGGGPVLPGAPGAGAPDGRPPHRDHHGHRPFRPCRDTRRSTDPGGPRPPRGEHRPPRATPRPPQDAPRPPQADPRPPRANPRPPYAGPMPPLADPQAPSTGLGPSRGDLRPPRPGPRRDLGRPRAAQRPSPDVSRPAFPGSNPAPPPQPGSPPFSGPSAPHEGPATLLVERRSPGGRAPAV